MTQIASLADVGQIINAVINMFLSLEFAPGIKLSYLIGFVLALGCVLTMLSNDGD
nr:unnamed protein product [uncultured bacterium]